MLLFSPLIAKIFFGDKELVYVVYIVAIATLIGATNSIISAPTRMQNKGMVYVVMNAIGPIISYSISIPLLLCGHYVIALPVAGLLTAIVNEIAFYGLNRKWFHIKLFKKDPKSNNPKKWEEILNLKKDIMGKITTCTKRKISPLTVKVQHSFLTAMCRHSDLKIAKI